MPSDHRGNPVGDNSKAKTTAERIAMIMEAFPGTTDVSDPAEVNKGIYDRRMAGESLEQVGDDLAMTREQVRRAEQDHMSLMRQQDWKDNS